MAHSTPRSLCRIFSILVPSTIMLYSIGLFIYHLITWPELREALLMPLLVVGSFISLLYLCAMSATPSASAVSAEADPTPATYKPAPRPSPADPSVTVIPIPVHLAPFLPAYPALVDAQAQFGGVVVGPPPRRIDGAHLQQLLALCREATAPAGADDDPARAAAKETARRAVVPVAGAFVRAVWKTTGAGDEAVTSLTGDEEEQEYPSEKKAMMESGQWTP